jgi:hypothetical protein
MNPDKYLHVFSLTEPDSFFLYYTENQDITTSAIECNINFDFVRSNPCLNHVETIPIADTMMVDYFVKKYMTIYGIPYVRGGSYIDKELPDFQLASLHLEMVTSSENFHHSISMPVKELLQKYTELELCDDEFIYNEKKKLSEEKKQIQNIKEKLDKYKYYLKNEALNHIEFIEEFIKFEIIKGDVLKKDTKEYYELVKKSLKKLAIGYAELFPEREKEEMSELTNPEFVFDYFFYHRKVLLNKTIWENKFNRANELVARYTIVYYHLKNRMDELQYDYTTYYTDDEYATIMCFFEILQNYDIDERVSMLQLIKEIQIEAVQLE